MSGGLRWHVLKAWVAGVSVAGLIPGLTGLFPGRAGVDPPVAGWRHLSLPLGLAVEPDWLAGWDGLSRMGIQPGPPAVVIAGSGQNGKAPDIPETQPFRLKLFGILHEDSATVYCFFDTEMNRWIRLIEGKEDLNVHAVVVPSPDGPVVRDLRNGSRYAINRDRYELIQLHEKEKNDAE